MHDKWKIILLLGFIFLAGGEAFAQRKAIKIKRAKILKEGPVPGSRRLIGNVVLVHDGATLKCDSAIHYQKKNALDSYGNVSIKQKKTTVTGDFMHYEGNTGNVNIVGNVLLKERDKKGKVNFELETPELDYNIKSKEAVYSKGALMTNKENKDQLYSKKGWFYTAQNVFHFKDSVALVSEDVHALSDTMKYNMDTETVFFYSPTTITSKDDFIYCEEGWYKKEEKKAEFKTNAYIISKDQRYEAQLMKYDDMDGSGELFDDVHIIDTANNFFVTGDYAKFNNTENSSLVTGHLLLTRAFDTDSLFLTSDTLYSTYDTTSKERSIFAYHHVKFFKSDLSGLCDSLVYLEKDSSFSLYNEPIVWSDERQITGDFIQLINQDGKLDYMEIQQNAFIISEADSAHFDQIKGDLVKGYFKDSKLDKVVVENNSESLYFVKEDDGSDIGLSNVTSTNIEITMKDNKIDRIKFIGESDGHLTPLKDVNTSDEQLNGFEWRIHEMPLSKIDLIK